MNCRSLKCAPHFYPPFSI